MYIIYVYYILYMADNSKTEQNAKCAPGKDFIDGSCISLNVLIDMVYAYNKYVTDNGMDNTLLIKLNNSNEILARKKYKKYLINEFEKRFKDQCSNSQVCWTKQSFINLMHEKQKDELLNYTIRPKGPEGKWEWLNTTNIVSSLRQYSEVHPDFIFWGAVPIDFDEIGLGISHEKLDEFVAHGIKKIGTIFNLDDSKHSGSHWVSSFANLDEGIVCYYDSYGIIPNKYVRAYMKNIALYCKNKLGKNPIAKYNKARHQYGGSECGVYSMNFIIRMLEGDTIEDIAKSYTTDDEINKFRKIYFR